MDEQQITIKDVIELVRFELRRYGFRADGGEITGNKNGLRVSFYPEPATGQAAFTQDGITPNFCLWVSDLPMEQAAAAVLPTPDKKQYVLDIGTQYTHCGGGSNGYSVRYILTTRWDHTPKLKRDA